jgi:hypothetical protein
MCWEFGNVLHLTTACQAAAGLQAGFLDMCSACLDAGAVFWEKQDKQLIVPIEC